MRPGVIRLALSSVLLCFSLSFGTARAEEVLRLGGTGAALATFRRMAADFGKTRPGFRAEIAPSLGSGGGIRALMDGALDVALSARPLKEEEKTKGLAITEYGTTPLVFAVGAATPCAGMTLAEVSEIYAGTRKTWQDGTPVRLVLRPAADTDTPILRAMSPRMAGAVEEAARRPGMVVADNDQDNVDAIESLPGGFGACPVAQLRSEMRSARPLPLDGVAPTPAELLKGTYPHAKHLYVVTRESPSPLVKAFLDHLFSKAGRRVLTDLGYVPSKRK